MYTIPQAIGYAISIGIIPAIVGAVLATLPQLKKRDTLVICATTYTGVAVSLLAYIGRARSHALGVSHTDFTIYHMVASVAAIACIASAAGWLRRKKG